DMSKDQTITAESDKSGGPVTYKLKAVESADASIVPDGWEKVSGYTMPSYMALYKTNMLYENEAYVLVADKRAKFSVLSNGYKFLTTLPEFYQQDPTATVIINGSATDDMIVVDGQVINQGRQTTTAGFGVTKAGTILIGDNFKVEWDKVKQNDSTAHYAMYAVQSLIEKGTLQDWMPKPRMRVPPSGLLPADIMYSSFARNTLRPVLRWSSNAISWPTGNVITLSVCRADRVRVCSSEGNGRSIRRRQMRLPDLPIRITTNRSDA
ncbi:MAG: hypothetical protein Q4F08_09080, partial [Rikenellaceae bacterium]|nr:hypothetical protein [Rikenellaceae bacterium]